MARTPTKVMVSLAAQTAQAMVDMARVAVREGCDGVELRLDALVRLDPLQVSGLVEGVRQVVADRPIIATCRDKAEGGINDHWLDDRIAAYVAAIKAGANWLDIELENYASPDVAMRLDQALASRPNARLILSCHSWDGPFIDLQAEYRRVLSICAHAVPKLVYMTGHICDCLPAMDLLHQARTEMIVFCMGHAGLFTRLLAGKLGSLFTYASCSGQTPTAPGQVPVGQMKGVYRLDRSGPGTRVFGLIGDPVGHSVGPHVHNACFAELGLDAIYLPLLVTGGKEGLFKLLEGFLARPWLDIRGLSVTLPHKEHALHFIQEKGGRIDPLALRIKAVNTVLISEDGRLEGYNTDYIGAMAVICQGLGIKKEMLRDWPVAVIGAGGVARAVVAGLCDVGAQVKIFNRTLSKAAALAQEFGCTYGPLEELATYKAALLINCTSVGMSPNVDQIPVPAEVLSPSMAVFDTVYNPVMTRLLDVASQNGCRCIDGLSMYAHQAVAQQRLFTSRDIDPGLIRDLAFAQLKPG